MFAFERGRYRVREASAPSDFDAIQDLRSRSFKADRNRSPDADRFDDICTQFMIEDHEEGRLICSFRTLMLDGGEAIGQTYSSQFYDLSALTAYSGPLLEIGRFCVDPLTNDPDLLRLAWGALASVVDENGVRLLFGCSSFQGLDPEPYLDAFALLRARHLAPQEWRPKVKSNDVFDFTLRIGTHSNHAGANAQLPPLLKTYLLMGGWVSDHAVIDAEMNTLHVFTGVEVNNIPETRKKLLRSVVAGAA